MKEGWFGDEHFIIFNENESVVATEEYAISNYLEGFQVVGLLGWDDFIVSNGSQFFTLPTVGVFQVSCHH
ncbi:hypothetical protein [Motilimonas eburnea]|uniref:hypothetical protein n=1 Tax=Motilimonas eburnea TaxID=1737488 RepID=UPI001E61C62E|nr:hypothetical protein [Motilimonas eburnea]MCE2573785.1 hypothetical protein [Motilimonas eburnea]